GPAASPAPAAEGAAGLGFLGAAGLPSGALPSADLDSGDLPSAGAAPSLRGARLPFSGDFSFVVVDSSTAGGAPAFSPLAMDHLASGFSAALPRLPARGRAKKCRKQPAFSVQTESVTPRRLRYPCSSPCPQ